MNLFENVTKSVVVVAAAIVGLFVSSISAFNLSAPEPLIGYKITVDGEVWAIVEDVEELEQTLDSYKSKYVVDIEETAIVKNVEFDADIVIEEASPVNNVFNDMDAILDRLYNTKEQSVYYTVQPGDSIWAIAINQDISIAEIMMYNPDLEPETIWPGDEIMIESEVPFLDVVVSMETTMIESIPYDIEYIEDNTLYRNQRVVVVEGIEGEKAVTYEVKTRNGYPDETIVVDELLLSEPSKATVRIGTKTTLMRSGGNNYGVVVGRFVSGFGNRRDPFTGKLKFHKAIDITAPRGTPVKAYTDGRVITAGWTGMGGNGVVIDHGNGLKTGYYHLSSISVSVGQRVTVGQKIGGVGSTGYSTGNHLHFEVIVNGKHVNPLNYI